MKRPVIANEVYYNEDLDQLFVPDLTCTELMVGGNIYLLESDMLYDYSKEEIKKSKHEREVLYHKKKQYLYGGHRYWLSFVIKPLGVKFGEKTKPPKPWKMKDVIYWAQVIGMFLIVLLAIGYVADLNGLLNFYYIFLLCIVFYGLGAARQN